MYLTVSRQNIYLYSISAGLSLKNMLRFAMGQRDLAAAEVLVVGQRSPSSRKDHRSSTTTQKDKGVPTRFHSGGKGAILNKFIGFTVSGDFAVTGHTKYINLDRMNLTI